jgi:hypothetical protein
VTTAAASPRRLPVPVTIARVLLAIVSAYHLFIPLFTLTHLELLRSDVAGNTPGIAPADVDHATTSAVTIALAVHIPLVVLTGFLAVALSSGHPWTLRPATVSQVLSIAFSTVSTPPFDLLRLLVPVFIAVGIAIIVLLWAPGTSRAFFRSHPRSRASRRNEEKSR